MFFQRKVAAMGEPDSTTQDKIKEIALAVMLGRRIYASALRESGLHVDFLLQSYEALKPEIQYLTGWQKLARYSYKPYWHNSTTDDTAQAKRFSSAWIDHLGKLELSTEQAVLLYDGESKRAPAPNYRVYLLRDGRLLFYEGGFHASSRKPPVCGDVLEVLSVMESLSSSWVNRNEQPYIILVEGFAKLLGDAIIWRKQQIQNQEALQTRMTTALAALISK